MRSFGLLSARTFAVLAAGLSIIASSSSSAAPTHSAVYNPAETFAPLNLPGPINRYRSANGAPGPDYWQNVPDYEIHADLDADAKTLTASMTISYTNNSPDTLDVLWLQLDQNIYRKDSRAGVSRGFRGNQSTEGYSIDSVEVDQGGHASPAPHLVSDTRMQVRLPAALVHAGKLTLRIKYHYTSSRAVRRPHLLGRDEERRHLRYRSMVPAHGGLRRHPRLGHRALSRPGVLPGVWPLRLLRHRAGGHDRCGHWRARQCKRRTHRDRARADGPGAVERRHRDDPHAGGGPRAQPRNPPAARL